MLLRRAVLHLPALAALFLGGCLYSSDGALVGLFVEDPEATLPPPAGPAAPIAGPVPGVFAKAEPRVRGVLGQFVLPPVGRVIPYSVQDAMPLYVGNRVYLLGGVLPSGAVSDQVLSADVLDNGELTTFKLLPDVKLATPRNAGWATRVGEYVYVIGGFTLAGNGPTAKVEAAKVGPDGTLGAFAEVQGVLLKAARGAFAGVNTGTCLTVVGGSGDFDLVNMTRDVTASERAVINADGTLGTFGKVDTPLVERRSGMSGFRVDDFFYVSGGKQSGTTGATMLRSVERASIAPDGTLGTFSSFSAPLSEARVGHATVTLSDDAYAIGGLDGSRKFFTGVDNATIMVNPAVGDPADLLAFEPYENSALVESYSGGVVIQISDKAVYYIGGYNPATRGEARIQRAPIKKVFGS